MVHSVISGQWPVARKAAHKPRLRVLESTRVVSCWPLAAGHVSPALTLLMLATGYWPLATSLQFLAFGRHVHAQVQPDLVELGANFLERGLAEVPDVQELVFRAADQVPDRRDSLALQAVGGADGELKFRQAHVELAFQLGIQWRVLMPVVGACLGGKARARLVVLDERIQVLAEDLGGLDESHLRAEDTRRPDSQDQLVVVGSLADASVLDMVLDALHRAEAGVDGDDANFKVVGVALGCRPVTAAVLDRHFQ